MGELAKEMERYQKLFKESKTWILVEVWLPYYQKLGIEWKCELIMEELDFRGYEFEDLENDKK